MLEDGREDDDEADRARYDRLDNEEREPEERNQGGEPTEGIEAESCQEGTLGRDLGQPAQIDTCTCFNSLGPY